MIVKGCVNLEKTLLSRKKSHNLAWSCAISNVFYCESAADVVHKLSDQIASLFWKKTRPRRSAKSAKTLPKYDVLHVLMACQFRATLFGK